MKKTILCSMLLLLLGCSKEDSNEYPKLIDPILIADDSLKGSGSEGINQSNQIILNQTDWQNLMIQLDSYSNVSNNFNETNIDFNQFIIIAIFDEIRSSGGNSIYTTQIIENKNNIQIFIESLQEGVNSVITQPFYIVKIPKSDKLIVFE